MPISKDGIPIATPDAWVASAGPVGPDHWADGRAAIEAARAWLGDDVDVPKELKAALKRHDGFGKVVRWTAEPRVALPFDDGVAAPVVDLVVEADDEHGAYLIVVDARTDEPFGDTVGDTLVAAVEAGLAGGTDEVGRVTRLAAALLGPRGDDDPLLKDIRHRLLAVSAGCLAEAERRGRLRALLLIQEFVTDRTVDRKLLQNTIDLGRFVKRLSHGAFKGLDAGDIAGPIRVPGAPLWSAPIDFHVGKISRNLRASHDRATHRTKGRS